MFLSLTAVLLGIMAVTVHSMREPTECDRFSYEYKIMERLLKLEAENANLKERVKQLEVSRDAKVAFKVRLSATKTIPNANRVMYDLAMWNIGKAFDLQKSEFLVPVSGIYFLYVKACLGYSSKWLDLDIFKDGEMVGRVFSGDKSYHSCGSEGVSIHLDKGDKIWVSWVAGSTRDLNQDHGWNVFTGVLVMTD